MAESRKTRAGKIAERVRDAVTDLDELRDEIENWKGSMEGTNLEFTQKYEDLGECEDSLDNAIGELESTAYDIDEIEFPGMFG